MDLYRIYDASDQLLYVGISYSAIERLAKHKVTQHWFASVARVERQDLGDVTRTEAQSIEADVIRAERPLHNKIHNAGGEMTVKKDRAVRYSSPLEKHAYRWFCDWCGKACIGERAYLLLDKDCNWHALHRGCDPIPQWWTLYWFSVDRIATKAEADDWHRHMAGKTFWKAAYSGWVRLLERGQIGVKATQAEHGEGTWRQELLESQWRKRWFIDRKKGHMGVAYPAPQGLRLVMFSWWSGEENGSRLVDQSEIDDGGIELFEIEQMWDEMVNRMARDSFHLNDIQAMQ